MDNPITGNKKPNMFLGFYPTYYLRLIYQAACTWLDEYDTVRNANTPERVQMSQIRDEAKEEYERRNP